MDLHLSGVFEQQKDTGRGTYSTEEIRRREPDVSRNPGGGQSVRFQRRGRK